MKQPSFLERFEKKAFELIHHPFGVYSGVGAFFFIIIYVRMFLVKLISSKAKKEIAEADLVDAVNRQRQEQLEQQADALQQQADQLTGHLIKDDWNKA